MKGEKAMFKKVYVSGSDYHSNWDLLLNETPICRVQIGLLNENAGKLSIWKYPAGQGIHANTLKRFFRNAVIENK